jgi:hypothetical protein
MLDGNAVAGILGEIFCVDITVALAECASCGKHGPFGAVQAYCEGPGIILRCPYCENILMRVAKTPRGTYVDMRGMENFRF